MDIVAEYGKDIETIYDQMKEVITREVQQMTHLEVIEVNVNVVDIKTQAEYQEESETVQDKLGNAAEATGSFMSKQTNKAKHAVTKRQDKSQRKHGTSCSIIGYYFIKNKAIIEETRRNEP